MKEKSVKIGPLENKLIFTLEEKEIKFFDFQMAKEILQAPDSSVRDVLYRLRKKNRITLLEKGKYALNPARSGLKGHWSEDGFLVVDYLMGGKDYYIAFWSALEFWGLTEQIPQILFVATTRKRKDILYGGLKIKFVAISKKRLFGSVKRSVFEVKGSPADRSNTFWVSSREKSILDALLYPKYCGGITEAAKALWNARDQLNWNVLLEYLERLDVSAVKRRLGYLLEVLDLKKDLQEKLEEPFKGFRWLDPSRSERILKYCKKWGLKLNLTEEEILSWREI